MVFCRGHRDESRYRLGKRRQGGILLEVFAARLGVEVHPNGRAEHQGFVSAWVRIRPPAVMEGADWVFPDQIPHQGAS